MTSSAIMRRVGVLERSRERVGSADLLVLFEPLTEEGRAKVRDHDRRGTQVLVVQFVEPTPRLAAG